MTYFIITKHPLFVPFSIFVLVTMICQTQDATASSQAPPKDCSAGHESHPDPQHKLSSTRVFAPNTAAACW
jgi:hypothetical protein